MDFNMDLFVVTNEGFNTKDIKTKIANWLSKIKRILGQLAQAIRTFISKFVSKLNTIQVNSNYYKEIMNLIHKIDNVDFSFKGKLANIKALLHLDMDTLDNAYDELAQKIMDLQDIKNNISSITPNFEGQIIKVNSDHVTKLKKRFELMEKSCTEDQISAQAVYQYFLAVLTQTESEGRIKTEDVDSIIMKVNKIMSIVTKKNTCNVARAKLMQQLVNMIINHSNKLTEYLKQKGMSNNMAISVNTTEAFIDFCDTMIITEESLRGTKKIGKNISNMNFEEYSIYNLPEDTVEQIDHKIDIIEDQKEKYMMIMKELSAMKPDAVDRLISGMGKIVNAGLKINNAYQTSKITDGILKGTASNASLSKMICISIGSIAASAIVNSYTVDAKKETIRKLLSIIKSNHNSLSRLEITLKNKRDSMSE